MHHWAVHQGKGRICSRNELLRRQRARSQVGWGSDQITVAGCHFPLGQGPRREERGFQRPPGETGTREGPAGGGAGAAEGIQPLWEAACLPATGGEIPWSRPSPALQFPPVPPTGHVRGLPRPAAGRAHHRASVCPHPISYDQGGGVT